MKDSRGFSGIAALVIIVLILIGVGAGFAVYSWQHSKVTSLNNKVNSLNSQITDLNNLVALLSSKVNSTQTSQQNQQSPNQPTPPKPNYSYTSTKGVSVLVYTPLRNATVSSPLAVIGEVPGSWSFEAQFPVQLKDSQGNIIAQASARLQGNWQTTQMVPFSAQLTFTAPQPGSGTLMLSKDNPSGLSQNADAVSIPVKF